MLIKNLFCKQHEFPMICFSTEPYVILKSIPSSQSENDEQDGI